MIYSDKVLSTLIMGLLLSLLAIVHWFKSWAGWWCFRVVAICCLYLLWIDIAPLALCSLGCVHLQVLCLQPRVWIQALDGNLIGNIFSHSGKCLAKSALVLWINVGEIQFLKPAVSEKRHWTLKRIQLPHKKLLVFLAGVKVWLGKEQVFPHPVLPGVTSSSLSPVFGIAHFVCGKMRRCWDHFLYLFFRRKLPVKASSVQYGIACIVRKRLFFCSEPTWVFA